MFSRLLDHNRTIMLSKNGGDDGETSGAPKCHPRDIMQQSARTRPRILTEIHKAYSNDGLGRDSYTSLYRIRPEMMISLELNIQEQNDISAGETHFQRPGLHWKWSELYYVQADHLFAINNIERSTFIWNVMDECYHNIRKVLSHCGNYSMWTPAYITILRDWIDSFDSVQLLLFRAAVRCQPIRLTWQLAHTPKTSRLD